MGTAVVAQSGNASGNRINQIRRELPPNDDPPIRLDCGGGNRVIRPPVRKGVVEVPALGKLTCSDTLRLVALPSEFVTVTE